MRIMKSSLVAVIFAISVMMSAQENRCFEAGLSGWRTSGSVVLDSVNNKEGKFCAKLGPGISTLFQRVDVQPLALIKTQAYLKVSDSLNRASFFMRFYDKDSILILNKKGKLLSNTSYVKYLNQYFEAPAKTKYLEYGFVSDDKNTGYVYVDSVGQIQITVDAPIVPKCNLEEYMKPFWSSDTIYNETILMFQPQGTTEISGMLMFNPKKIIGIKSFDLTKEFKDGVDYVYSGRKVVLTDKSTMPFKKQSDLSSINLNWNDIQSQWVSVTYIPEYRPNIHYFDFKADKLETTYQKLKNKRPVKVVALGMSITRGYDMSGYVGVAPNMPNYVSLFTYKLRKLFGYDEIECVNAGLPGAQAKWMGDYADLYVNPYKPDLVILDMGMNDFWSTSPQNFKSDIQKAINRVRAENPKAEFMLISNTLFDPDYVTDGNLKSYYERMRGFNSALQSLEEDGIVNVDLTTVSDTIFHRKKAKDCMANPLHPNDYMGRWYAQGMVAVFDSMKVNPSVNYCGNFKASFDRSGNTVTFSGLNNGGKIWIGNSTDNWRTFEEITPQLKEGQDVATVKLKGRVGQITMFGMNEKGLNKCSKNFNFLADPNVPYIGCSNFKATYDEKTGILTVTGLNNGGTNWIAHTPDNWKSYKDITPSLGKNQDVARIAIKQPVGIVSMWTRDTNGENTCNTDVDFVNRSSFTKFSDVSEYPVPVSPTDVVTLNGDFGEKTTVSILDLQGHELKSIKPRVYKTHIEINLDVVSLSPGYYLIKAQHGRLFSVTKLAVK